MNKTDLVSKGFKALALAAVLTSACGIASAQLSLNAGGSGGSSVTGNITYNNLNGGTTNAGSWGSAGAQWYNDGTSSFYAYCIDPLTSGHAAGAYTAASLSNFLSTGNPTGYAQEFGWTANTGAGAVNAGGYAGKSYTGQTASVVQASLVALFSHAYADSLTSGVKAAAFNYAVWEIMGDGSTGTYSRTSGALQGFGSNGLASIDSTDTAIDAYLSALSTNSWGSVNGANLTTATNYIYTVYYDPALHNNQNFIRVTTAGVPEPGSLALVGLAMLGLVGARRRIFGRR